jgi:hypothetical protein
MFVEGFGGARKSPIFSPLKDRYGEPERGGVNGSR